MVYYTVYKITNRINNKIYVGVHKTTDLNDMYMGSGINIHRAIEKYGISNFVKDYLAVFDNFDDMINMESKLVDLKFVQRFDTYNIALGGCTGMQGLVAVKDANGTKSVTCTSDPRYLSGELVSATKGQFRAKNKEGKFFFITKDDPRYLSGELVIWSKGRALVRDSDNNFFTVSVDDPRYLSGELVPGNKGRKIHTEEFKRKIGEQNSILQKGPNGSAWGKCWIYNSVLKLNKKIKKEELATWVLEGWQKGRKMTFY